MKILQEPSLTVEDFAYYLHESKDIPYQLGCGNLDTINNYSPHHKKLDINENCLPLGQVLQTFNVYAYLQGI